MHGVELGPRFGRRTALRGLGGGALLLPFLPTLSRTARGAPSSPPKIVFITQPMGSFGEAFFPTPPGETPFRWPHPNWNRQQRKRNAFTGNAYGVFPGPNLNNQILEPLAPFADRVTVLENLCNMTAGRTSQGHDQFAGILSGWEIKREIAQASPGPSLDLVLGSLMGAGTLLPSTQLSLFTKAKGPFYAFTSWGENQTIIPPETDPGRFFRRVFGDGGAPASGPNPLVSILDSVGVHARSLQARLGVEDRRRLDGYLTAVREIEAQLGAEASLDCGNAGPVDAPPDAALDVRANAMVELIALSLTCDATRVVNFQLGREGSSARFPFLGNDRFVWHQGLDHAKGHEDSAVERLGALIDVERWVASLVARLARRLDELGTLENTLIVWLHNMGAGTWHSNDCAPVVLVGDLGGRLRTNQHVRYAFLNTRDRRVKRQLIDLYFTLAAALDLTLPAHYGDPRLFGGLLDELLV